MFRTAQILVVGSEFFSRDKVDSNSTWLTEQLERMGVRVLSKCVVADDLGQLTQVIKRGLEAVDLVISTGGLGPTEDDRTREAAARAFGVDLEFRTELEEQIRQRFARRGIRMTDNNRRQAYLPAGGTAIANSNGSAPGFYCAAGTTYFVALPGPPGEMQGMFNTFMTQHNDLLSPESLVVVRRTLRVTGLGESEMDGRISDLYKDVENPEVTINFTPHDLEIHLTAKAVNEHTAQSLMEPLVATMEERLAGYLFSAEDRSLAEVVVEMLQNSGLRLASAESVTGGHFAHKICSVPGASKVFSGSVVAYTEDCKQRILGVSGESIELQGVVSEQVAVEMAEGVSRLTGSPLAISCTGYAGPEGGTRRDPVGTVYVAFKSPEKTTVKRLSLPGTRNLLRSRTTQAMLFLLFRYLRERR